MRLKATIADAWTVFGRYRFEAPIEVCRCASCVGPETYELFLTTPIAWMPQALVAEYTNSAHGPGRIVDEQFRALLPRYFELIAAGEWPSLDPVITLRRLVTAGWREAWPAAEVATIDAYFIALFEFWLGHRDGVGNAGGGDVLGAIAYAGGPLEKLLAIWDETPDPLASVKLAELVISTAWGKRRSLGAFWEPMEDKELLVLNWLIRPETLVRLMESKLMTADPGEQRKFREAEDSLL